MIKFTKLRSQFVEVDSDKKYQKLSDRLLRWESKGDLEIRKIKTFTWRPSDEDLKQFVTV